MPRALVAVAVLALAALPGAAASGARSSAACSAVPYEGWVEKGGKRAHWMFPGERGTIVFLNCSKRPVYYRVCLKRWTSGENMRCWTRGVSGGRVRTNRIGVTTDPYLGKLSVVWYVGGRVVSYWTLYMVGE